MIRASRKKEKKYTRQMGIRFTMDEWEKLRKESKQAGCSRTEYIRQQIGKGTVVSADELQQLRIELNKIGTNINRWTKQMHSEGVTGAKLRLFISDLDKARTTLLRIRRRW